ncbi:hypothetical protein MKX01_012777, partial [Papaver californicum]
MDPVIVFYNFPSLQFFSFHQIYSLVSGNVGVNYGRRGDNLPSPNAVVNLLRSRNVDRIRLFRDDPDFAGNWIWKNVLSFTDVHFRYISVGNEIEIPSAEASNHIVPAMKNLNNALTATGKTISVSTTISFGLVVDSFPPSSGRFSDNAENIMRSIVEFLVANRSPLLVNIYPYFSYDGDQQQMPLDYALFTADRVVKVGGANVDIVISESGWPSSENGNMATIPN